MVSSTIRPAVYISGFQNVYSREYILFQYYYLCKKCITKNENNSFNHNKSTSYCSMMYQYLVWHPLAWIKAAIVSGIDS